MGGRLAPALCALLDAAAAHAQDDRARAQELVGRAFGLFDCAADLADGSRALGGPHSCEALLHACGATGLWAHQSALRAELAQERLSAVESASVLPWRSRHDGHPTSAPY